MFKCISWWKRLREVCEKIYCIQVLKSKIVMSCNSLPSRCLAMTSVKNLQNPMLKNKNARNKLGSSIFNINCTSTTSYFPQIWIYEIACKDWDEDIIRRNWTSSQQEGRRAPQQPQHSKATQQKRYKVA